MRDVTPQGAKVPWRSAPSVRPIQALLDDGVPAQELADLVADASEFIRAGHQDVRWWYPANLFGEQTCQRWLADIAAWRGSQARADKRSAELEEHEAREQAEREAARAAPKPAVVDLDLRSLAARCMQQVRDREAAKVAGEAEEAREA
jgi:hypothetical protein